MGGFEPTERKTRDVGVWLENLAKPPPWYSDSQCPLPWEGEVYSHPEPSCFRVLIIRAETLTFTPFGSVFSSGSHWSSETFFDGHNLEHGYPRHPEDEGQGYHSTSSSTQDTLPCPFRDVRGSVLVGSRNPDSNKEGRGWGGGWRVAGRAQHLSWACTEAEAVCILRGEDGNSSEIALQLAQAAAFSLLLCLSHWLIYENNDSVCSTDVSMELEAEEVRKGEAAVGQSLDAGAW